MNVNALGPVRMTRAFGPLIIAAKGRIVNISSVSGILAGENTSAYAMSKHAVEAFTDSLATEMERSACTSVQSSRGTTTRRSFTTLPRAWESRRA